MQNVVTEIFCSVVVGVLGLEGLQVSPCPVTGEYSGFIPKQIGLCARLASDPTHQEIMYFTVSDCEQQEVYEGTLTYLWPTYRKLLSVRCPL